MLAKCLLYTVIDNSVFQKLLSRNVPLFIVRILDMWYTHQKMCIRQGNAISPSFTVSNGVKQGGILSPILFNVYMDRLSVLFNSSNIGGQIGHTFLNHLCYADDLCLISLSSASMQNLLNLYSKYAVNHSLTYNAKKVVFAMYYYKNVPFVLLLQLDTDLTLSLYLSFTIY